MPRCKPMANLLFLVVKNILEMNSCSLVSVISFSQATLFAIFPYFQQLGLFYRATSKPTVVDSATITAGLFQFLGEYIFMSFLNISLIILIATVFFSFMF